MKRGDAIEVIVHRPAGPDGEALLARRLADAQAECVADAIASLTCPDGQKRALIEAVTRLAAGRDRAE